MKRLIVTIVILLACNLAVVAQVVLSGTVKDPEGNPVVAASVRLKQSDVQASTDKNGRYRINSQVSTGILVVSYVGMETREIQFDGSAALDITLNRLTESMSEVVVVGYGTQSRESITSSIAKVDMKVAESAPIANAAAALQGTVSGVRVQQGSGQPGAAPTVIIRGGASIDNPNGAQPLYIVDGIQRDNMDGINTANIESMQVLKDASATAIYGARASNGVVIVETKKGKAGSSSVTVRSSVGFSNLREKVPVLNGEQYIYYMRIGAAASAAARQGIFHSDDNYASWAQANNFGGGIAPWATTNDLGNLTFYSTQYLSDANKHKLNEGWKSITDPLYPDRTIIYSETDWQDQLFRTGVTQNHNVSINGGSERAVVGLSVGFLDQKGIAIRTNYQRFSGDLNGRLQVNDRLSVTGLLGYNQDDNNQVYSENLLFERTVAMSPVTKYQFEDGTLAPGTSRELGNPEYHISRNQNQGVRSFLTLKGGLQYDILDNLQFRTNASLFVRNTEQHNFLMSYNNGTAGVDIVDRPASATFTKWHQQEFDGVLDYQETFGNNHSFNGLAGLSYFDRNYTDILAAGRGAVTDNIPTLNASAEATSVSSMMRQLRIFGAFTRLNYAYDNRYLLTLTGRYDGATNLGEGNKWGFFPAASAGWNIHNEQFWNNPLQINQLKFRASYGSSGNLGNLADYQAQGEYSVGGSYNSNAAIVYQTLANPQLQWESSTTTNAGVEIGLFKNRITFVGEYYQRITRNLITSFSLPASTGFTNILTNLGALKNYGIELELNTSLIEKQDFGWSISANASKNNNRILKLPTNQNENNRIGGWQVYDESVGAYVWKGGLQEGGRMGDMYAFKQVGIYATQADADQGPLNTMRLQFDSKNYAGDAEFYDTDKNGIIDLRDRVYVGNEYPVWTGGLSTNMRYKRLSLYVRADFTTGHTIMNYVRASNNGVYGEGLNPTTDILNAWKQPGDQTDIPKFYMTDQIVRGNTWMGDSRRVGGGSSFYYEKGDYLSFREVSLSYLLDGRKYLGTFNSLRLNLTATNLGYVSNYFGLNPEVGGWDRGRYPLPRQIVLGLNMTL